MPKIVPKIVQTKIFKIKKKFQKSKHAQNRSQKCSNVFWSCFRVIFSKKLFAQCSVEGRVFENFPKNQKIFKIPKRPKIVPKSVQTCFEDVLGWFFRKNFLPSVPRRVESSKIFKKIKKVSKFQKCPKSFPKLSKRKFSKKSKNIQNSKNAQNRSQKCPNVFWRCFRVIFSKKFFAQCSMEGRVFENFQKKIKKVSKFQKCPKSSPKVSKRKFSNSKKFQKSKHAQNRSQKCPNVFWSCFRVIFSKKLFAQCSVEGRVFENFPKNQKIFKIPKRPKIVPKSV